MLPRKDITGQTFGRLTTLYPTGHTDKYHNAIWHFRCSCGNEVDISRANVIAGRTKSCGCLRRSTPKPQTVEEVVPTPPKRRGKQRCDITGQTFGKLTALYSLPELRYGHTVWHCRCECGREVDVPLGSLRQGSTKSCGSLQGDTSDLTGQTFGRLTVFGRTGKNGMWRCMCTCGRVIETNKTGLLNGTRKSCGCGKKDDLTGRRFGRLTVLYDTGTTKPYHGPIWHCKCDCGNEVDVVAGSLKNGNTRSCGCLRMKHVRAETSLS